ncbi:MAG TPA: hypothetical protein VFR15_19970 [Chloroflexia bacterium]|nr:hypothetical protein [Chloroflexia bacterium]
MKGRITLVAAALVAVVALGAAFAPVALAQPATPGAGAGNGPAATQGNPPAANQGYGPGMMAGRSQQGMMGGRGMHGGMMGGQGMMGSENSLIAVTAEQLNITVEELIAELDGTNSIAQVAAAHNVSVDTIVNAFLAPRIERLNEAVASGRITQEQADQMIATMRTNVTTHINEVWTPRGPGQGQGFVDENGDGVCDNMPAGGQPGQGMMGQNRGGRR